MEEKVLSRGNIFTGMVYDRDYGFCIKHRKDSRGRYYLTYIGEMKKIRGERRIYHSELKERTEQMLELEKRKAVRLREYLRRYSKEYTQLALRIIISDYKQTAFALATCQKEYIKTYKQTCRSEKLEQTYIFELKRLEKQLLILEEQMKEIKLVLSPENPWIQLHLSWNKDYIETEELRSYVGGIEMCGTEKIRIVSAENEWYEKLPEGIKKAAGIIER